MKVVHYTVTPYIPEPLKPLEELARNLWVSWNYEAINLFVRLDYDAWTRSGQNPARMLGMVSRERLEQLSTDDSYLQALHSVNERFQHYKSAETWYDATEHEDSGEDVIAYFSMEYGLDVSLPIYSGGLGMLSGDHLKTASDMGLPLVGVGLLYRQGYFQQYLNADGYQQENYPENDWYNMPVSRCTDENGDDVKIAVQMADAVVSARIWQVRIGRNTLYLLDTNINENDEEHQLITAALYGGDRERRIQQEILLGIGGIRALRKLGINPSVTHMNEGHSAFLGVERIRELVQQHGLSTYQAIQALIPTNIFTTHTPVPAGNERFSVEVMEKYFPSIAGGLDIDFDDFMALGRENPEDGMEHFCMTVLALKLSAYNNGVSELHGHVSREMWQGIWPDVPRREVPITHITNGVHPRSHQSHDVQDLLYRYFGPRYYDEPTKLDIWDRMDRITDDELWRTHERRKARLVAFARERLREQLTRRGVSRNEVLQAEEVLSPSVLTISFARRFATYKRGTLLLREPERIIRLLTDAERPIQLIFAGKAHPHDVPGKNLIKELVHFASKPEVRHRIVFLENYDITVARYLVSGSDLWLNTPRRPQEASGTSGMKAAINGVLNCSVLDGWWAEAYHPEIGWAIGNGEEYNDPEEQDEIESKALYDLLERDIIPTFYDRGADGLPREWIHKMKASMTYVGKQFSSHRMLKEYSRNFYFPALKNAQRFRANAYQPPKHLAEHLERVKASWDDVYVEELPELAEPSLDVGDRLEAEAVVHLGALSPEDVRVELYYGPMNSRGEIDDASRQPMEGEPVDAEETRYRFRGTINCDQAGRQGYAVRVLPRHELLVHDFIPSLIEWG
jgi:starch phosphorylase